MQIKGLSNVKEEVYGALDSFIAWELEFPLITVKKSLKALEIEKEWKRIIQVILSCVYYSQMLPLHLFSDPPVITLLFLIKLFLGD